MSSSKKRGKSSSEGPSSQKKRREVSNDDDPSSPFAWTPSGVQVLLPSSQRLIFIGKATLTVHSGEIDVAGTILTARSLPAEVCTDETVPLVISVVATEGRIPLASSGTAGFSIAGGNSPENRGFEVHIENEYDAINILEIPAAWKHAASGITESIQAGQAVGAPPPIIAICGSKKVGKSTFARYVSNVLLNTHPSVAYLDTDCGQPEFTPSGLLSLSILSSPIVGPPHLHQRPPAASYFIGDTSPSTDPARYLCSITNLYEWYCTHGSTISTKIPNTQSKSSKKGLNTTITNNRNSNKKSLPSPSPPPPPLIVNTHGWVKGFGFDLLVDTLRMLGPTHYVHILASNPRRNLPHGVFWAVPPPTSLGRGGGDIGGGESSSQYQEQQRQIMPVMFDLPALEPATGGGGRDNRDNATTATGAGSGHESEVTTTTTPGQQNNSRRIPAPPAAVEQRALHWISFAERCVAAHSKSDASTEGIATATGSCSRTSTAEEVGDQLAAACPYVISLSDVYVKVIHASVLSSQLAYALNGALVGLCGKHHQGKNSSGGGDASVNNGLTPCLGLGLIRTADGASGKLYILTPLSLKELEQVEVLEIGRLELPPALLQTGKHLSPYLALHSLSTAGTGAGAIKSRNNLMRSGQR